MYQIKYFQAENYKTATQLANNWLDNREGITIVDITYILLDDEIRISILYQFVIVKSCSVPCGPSDFVKEGKCDNNKCYRPGKL